MAFSHINKQELILAHRYFDSNVYYKNPNKYIPILRLLTNKDGTMLTNLAPVMLDRDIGNVQYTLFSEVCPEADSGTMIRWVETKGIEYGWNKCNSTEEIKDALESGKVIFGGNEDHNFILVGMPIGKEREIIPILMQATNDEITPLDWHHVKINPEKKVYKFFSHTINSPT